MDRQKSGKDAEKQAENFLKLKKLKLVQRNFHSRYGEIDLIMLDRKTLVFIEVRLRSSSDFGNAAESVTIQKQRKIITTAQYFLSRYSEFSNRICRFDVIAFNSDAADVKPVWYKDAFRP